MNKERKMELREAVKKAYISKSLRTAEKIIFKAAESKIKSKSKN